MTNPAGHTGSIELDPAWGAELGKNDANNRRTDLAYDALGRLIKVWLPDRPKATNTPNSEYSYLVRTDGPSVVTSKAIKDDGTYLTSYDLFDGLLRPRQTQAPSVTGTGRVLTDTYYDSRGQQYKANGAYYNGSAPGTALLSVVDSTVQNQTIKTFDGAGRTTAEILISYGIEKWRSTLAYNGEVTTVTPPTGGTKTSTIRDVRGRPMEMRELAPDGSSNLTRYGYDAAGNLAVVTDPVGNIWRYTYDLRGRKVTDEDPDKGTSTFTYDDAGQMLTTTDARGVTLAYSYDILGRKTGLYEGSTSGTKRAEWKYDTFPDGTTTKGYPVSSTRWLNGNAYASSVLGYDTMYRPTGTQVVIPSVEGPLAGTYKTTVGYTPTGNVSWIQLPPGGKLLTEKITYGYNSFGLLTSTKGATTYVNNTLYSEFGQPTQIDIGSPGKHLWQSYIYDPATSQVKRTRLVREITGDSSVADLNYSYDPAGNVTKIADTPEGGQADTQCFRYDFLRRMTDAWTATDSCVAVPSAATVGGPDAYWHSYTFDKIGGRLSETKHDTTGNSANDATSTYTYPPAGTDGPHALSTVTTVGPAGTSSSRYSYDNTGNMNSRVIAGVMQTLNWDAEGRLSTVSQGAGDTVQTTDSVYDADGNRIIRRDPTGATLTVSGMELRLDKATNTVTGTRYYSHGSSLVGTRVGAKVTWIFSDHHGTATVSVDGSTLAVTRRKFTPYGQPRSAWPTTWQGERGFVGGQIDASTGLVQLGARAYDPLIGRFISVDPIIDHADPQQANGYAYAHNAPATRSDPTGLYDPDVNDYCNSTPQNCNSTRTEINSAPVNPVDEVDETERYDWSKEFRQWYNEAHNLAVALRCTYLKDKYRPYKGKNGQWISPQIRVNVYVPKGSSQGNKNKGYADLVCWDCAEGEVWVWEIKHQGGDAEAGGPAQLTRYVNLMRKMYVDYRVKKGPKFELEQSAQMSNGRDTVVVNSSRKRNGSGIELYRIYRDDDGSHDDKYRVRKHISPTENTPAPIPGPQPGPGSPRGGPSPPSSTPSPMPTPTYPGSNPDQVPGEWAPGKILEPVGAVIIGGVIVAGILGCVVIGPACPTAA